MSSISKPMAETSIKETHEEKPVEEKTTKPVEEKGSEETVEEKATEEKTTETDKPIEKTDTTDKEKRPRETEPEETTKRRELDRKEAEPPKTFGFSNASGGFSSLLSKPSSFSTLLDTRETEQEDDEEAAPVDDEQYVAVKLEKTVVPTGEEDDVCIHTVRAKLYAINPKSLDDGWKERGVGTLRVLESTKNGHTSVRLVMRADAVLRVILNMPLRRFYKLEDGGDSMGDKTIRIFGVEDGMGTWLALKVGNKAAAEQLKGVIQKGMDCDIDKAADSSAEVPASTVTDLETETPVAVHATTASSVEDSVATAEI